LIDGSYNSDYLATQISGFSFGQGEAAQELGSKHPNGKKIYANDKDRSGGGGGLFGGFSSHDGQGGSCGGSSFAFTKDCTLLDIPYNNYTYSDEYYSNNISKPYAFSKTSSSEYFISNSLFSQGIWSGNGLARITFFSLSQKTCFSSYIFPHHFIITLLISLCE
jgi:hypothetical protein